MYARDDLADASLDAGLVTEVGNIFASLSDDDAGVLGADKSSESENVLTSRRRRPRLVWGRCEERCGEKKIGDLISEDEDQIRSEKKTDQSHG